jgi:hypothetical protein
MRMRHLIGFLAVVVLVASCDSGPDGPGDIMGSVRSSHSSLGGVVLEVVAEGVEGFSGAGGTRVLWAPQSTPGLYRVIVIGQSGSELAFTASVKDRAMRMPRATVVGAVDLENLPLPVAEDFEVDFRR